MIPKSGYRLGTCGCGKRRKTALEIGDQIVDRLKADVESHCRPARLPARSGAQRCAIEWNSQALIAAPGRADAEQFERVEKGVIRFLRHWLEHHAEQSRGAGKIALPDGVSGMARQRRMQ